MGRSVEIISFNYNALIKGIEEYTGSKDTILIKRILNRCGNRIGDKYIIVDNEYLEENNAYEHVGRIIDLAFNIDDSFGKIFCTIENKFERKAIISSVEPYEILNELGIEENDYEEL